MALSMGSAKASVLPLPVSAIPTTSRDEDCCLEEEDDDDERVDQHWA